MAKCAYCGSETELFNNGVAVCLKCSDDHEGKSKPPQTEPYIRTILVNDIVKATARVSAANQTFSAVMGQVPSGLPHPDGAQRIHNASRELSIARERMMTAHTRLNKFIEHGIVPEDLK